MPEPVEGMHGQVAEVAHGVDCVALMLNQRRTGPRGSIVLTPKAARQLANQLREQAGYAERTEASE